jgi:hypothetical protein
VQVSLAVPCKLIGGAVHGITASASIGSLQPVFIDWLERALQRQLMFNQAATILSLSRLVESRMLNSVVDDTQVNIYEGLVRQIILDKPVFILLKDLFGSEDSDVRENATLGLAGLATNGLFESCLCDPTTHVCAQGNFERKSSKSGSSNRLDNNSEAYTVACNGLQPRHCRNWQNIVRSTILVCCVTDIWTKISFDGKSSRSESSSCSQSYSEAKIAVCVVLQRRHCLE